MPSNQYLQQGNRENFRTVGKSHRFISSFVKVKDQEGVTEAEGEWNIYSKVGHVCLDRTARDTDSNLYYFYFPIVGVGVGGKG